jgi:hypothetical protein
MLTWHIIHLNVQSDGFKIDDPGFGNKASNRGVPSFGSLLGDGLV